MLAEVKAELGDEVTAKQYLSEVHNRAFATPELANLDGFISKWGGIKEAEVLFGAATGAGDEVNYNKGIVAIMKGDYKAAVDNSYWKTS